MKKIGIRFATAIISAFITIISCGIKVEAYADTYIKEEYIQYCEEIGNGYDIDCWLLVALIERESSGNPNAVDSFTGTHIGLMQLSIYYFGDYGIDLTDPYGNIMLGTRYLASLRDKYGDIGIALMAYHGEGNVTTKPLSGYAQGILDRAADLKNDRGKVLINRMVDNKSLKEWSEDNGQG